MTLTTDQKMTIDRYLRKENWLLNENLIAELTDHYSEGISERLANGLSFEAALREIHTGFGERKGLLNMEETYQAQQFHQLDRMEWRLIQSFLHGSRWFTSAGIFISLFLLNTYLGQQEVVESVSFVALSFVTISVLGNLLRGIILFYKHRREVNAASLNATSPLFVGLYIVSFSLLAANKYLYGYGLSSQLITSLNTILETLCIIYYIAIVMGVRNYYLVNRRSRLTNAS